MAQTARACASGRAWALLMAFCVSVHIRTTTGRRYAVLRSAVQQSHGTQTQNSGAYRAAAAAGDCGGGRAGAHCAERLAEQQAALLEESLLASKRAELKHYVELALSSIEPLYANPRLPREQAQTQAKAILQGLSFGDDGYFFAYDTGGRNLVHPSPARAGRAQSVGFDRPARPPCDPRVRWLPPATATAYQRYGWENLHPPDDGKLGYGAAACAGGWMLGTGIYLTMSSAPPPRCANARAANARSTLLALGAVALVAVLLVFAWRAGAECQRTPAGRQQAQSHGPAHCAIAGRRVCGCRASCTTAFRSYWCR